MLRFTRHWEEVGSRSKICLPEFELTATCRAYRNCRPVIAFFNSRATVRLRSIYAGLPRSRLRPAETRKERS